MNPNTPLKSVASHRDIWSQSLATGLLTSALYALVRLRGEQGGLSRLFTWSVLAYGLVLAVVLGVIKEIRAEHARARAR